VYLVYVGVGGWVLVSSAEEQVGAVGSSLFPIHRVGVVRSLVSVSAQPRTHLPGIVLLVGQAQGQRADPEVQELVSRYQEQGA